METVSIMGVGMNGAIAYGSVPSIIVTIIYKFWNVGCDGFSATRAAGVKIMSGSR
ncbi:hypothetical protein [Microseira sp. BLCC-F43]|uniref:hypothetical protein n=1 Tax=Microseira sp. BLCC-F43 TaxID=3153602 RepID=UPI0035B7C05D